MMDPARSLPKTQKENILMTMIPALLLQDDSTGSTVAALLGSTMVLVVCLAIAVVFIIGFWKTFVKAGQPGWACIVPIYNIYILIKIAGKPGWWTVLWFIPFVNIVIGIIVCISIAKAFGLSAAFGVIMLFFLGSICYLILGFGSDRHRGPPA